MINNLAVSLPASPPQPAVADRLAKAAATLAASGSAPHAGAAAIPASQPGVRLMVEEKHDAPGFIYKLVDSVTGRTLAEIPREPDAAPHVSNGYSAGRVVTTTV